MPRKSRCSIISSFVHVMVQGINKESIFVEDKSKKKYLNFLFKNLKDYEIDTIAFCVMGNHTHCLFNFNNIVDVSNLMHNTNTAYAKWYNNEKGRVGYVFRDRFKIEEIKDLHHLYSCIKYIHNNPVKAGIVDAPGDYQYSSFMDYRKHCGIYNSKLLEVLGLSETDLDKIVLNVQENSSDDFYECNSQYKISRFFEEKGLDSISNIRDLMSKKKIINFLKDSCKMNNTEISKVLNVSRRTVQRTLKLK